MNIKAIGSPNFTQGRGGNKVQGAVIHWMAGTLAATDAVFQNTTRNTSAHWGVENDEVHAYVSEEDTAYHAGNWQVNQTTIGIENSAAPGRAASDATYESSAQLIAAAAKKWGFAINSSTIRPHSSIVATQCPGTIDIPRLIKRANELAGGSLPATSPPVTPTVKVAGTATVLVPQLNVRSKPTSQSPLAGSMTLNQGDQFQFVGVVKGEMVNGVSTWLISTKGNSVWAGGTDYPTTPAVSSGGGTAEAIREANVRTAPNTSAPLGGSMTLNPGDQFNYSAKVYGEQVSQNGVTSNVWYRSTKGNFVWSGNCKDV